MFQSSNLLQSGCHYHLLQPPSQTLPLPFLKTHNIPTCPSPSPPILTHSCKFSRRELTIFTNTSLLLLVSSHTLLPNSQAEEENPAQTNEENTLQGGGSPLQAVDKITAVDEDSGIQTIEETTSEVKSIQTVDKATTEKEAPPKTVQGSNKRKTANRRAFLDISIDGKPMGRIIIAFDQENAPTGASRFSDLVSGKVGISYRRKEFIKITPNYVQHAGVRSYGVDAEMAKRTGKDLSNDILIQEWEKMNESLGTRNLAGTVSIIVRDPMKPPPKMKLVARKGKLEIDQEEVGIEPNGTEFVIATKDTPELDASALVIGRVIKGMDVVEKIGQVKTVQENTSSPYFRVAKLIGDKRAVVAERGFNRPYSKVLVTNCGLLE